MPEGPLNPKELGSYFALAQVGLEMVVPVGIGLTLDYYFEWGAWGAVGGAVLGLVIGIVHLLALTSRQDSNNSSKPRRDEE